MRQSAFLVLGLVVLAQLAAAQQSKKLPLDGATVNAALHDFIAEVRSAVQQDSSTWRDRIGKMRQVVSDRLGAAQSASSASSTEATRRLLTVAAVKNAVDHVIDVKVDVTKDILSKGWDLIMDSGSAIKNVMSLKSAKVHEFFADILGPDWKAWVPPALLDSGFSWDDLTSLSFPQSLQQFVSPDAIQKLTHPQSLGDLYDSMNLVLDKFCVGDKYSPPGKLPTICVGPLVNVTYHPKSCTIDEARKEIVCVPAQLVLVSAPGYCTLKTYNPTQWIGKKCQLKKNIGHPTNATLGGEHHKVPLGDVDFETVHEWAAELVHAHHDPGAVPTSTPSDPAAAPVLPAAATAAPVITSSGSSAPRVTA